MTDKYKFILSNRFLFDARANTLQDSTKQDAELSIGNNESRLLAYFCQNPNSLLSRETIQQRVWSDQGLHVDDSSLTQAIFNLRKLLNDSAKKPKYIVTLPKQGYRFIAQVQTDETAAEVNAASLAQSLTATDLEALAIQRMKQSAIEQAAKPDVLPLSAEKKSAGHIRLFSPSMVAAFIVVVVSAVIMAGFYSHKPGFIAVSDLDGVPIKTYNGSSANQDWAALVDSCLIRYSADDSERARPEQVIITGDQDSRVNINLLFDKSHASNNVTLRLLPNADGQLYGCTI